MDIFYKMKGVSINGIDVNCSNITEFKYLADTLLATGFPVEYST